MERRDIIFQSITDILPVRTSHGVGEKRVIANRDTVGAPITQIAKTFLRSGEFVDVHIHPTMNEHFIILGGECVIKGDNKDYNCSSGDYLFLPAGVSHSISILVDTTMITIGVEC